MLKAGHLLRDHDWASGNYFHVISFRLLDHNIF